MRQFVQSLHRLYKTGRVSQDKIQDYLSKNTITKAEYDYIVGTSAT